MGPTGSGKSFLAERFAKELEAQLINADAFQVYKGFDVGTNKPALKEHYNLLDIKKPQESFSVGEWIGLVLKILNGLWDQKKHAVVVGGTGLYIRALFEEWKDLSPPPPQEVRNKIMEQERKWGIPKLFQELQRLDPDSASKLDPNNRARVRRALEKALVPQAKIPFSLPTFQKFKLGIQWPVDRLNSLLDQRTEYLLKSGWIEEAERLKKEGITEELPAMRAIGYRTIFRLLENQISFEEALLNIQTETKQYAKRQRTWLRSEPHVKELFVQDLKELEQKQLASIL